MQKPLSLLPASPGVTITTAVLVSLRYINFDLQNKLCTFPVRAEKGWCFDNLGDALKTFQMHKISDDVYIYVNGILMNELPCSMLVRAGGCLASSVTRLFRQETRGSHTIDPLLNAGDAL